MTKAVISKTKLLENHNPLAQAVVVDAGNVMLLVLLISKSPLTSKTLRISGLSEIPAARLIRPFRTLAPISAVNLTYGLTCASTAAVIWVSWVKVGVQPDVYELALSKRSR